MKTTVSLKNIGVQMMTKFSAFQIPRQNQPLGQFDQFGNGRFHNTRGIRHGVSALRSTTR